MPFAILTLSLTLYPYVYLMARAALRDQAANAQIVARTLGASRAEATRRVVLPLLRPAIAAGAAVVAMETLTDFATVQYFNVETVTVGVFRIWRGTYDRDAASEIASLVLMFALLAIAFERLLRGRARFGESGGQSAGVEPTAAAPASRAAAATVATGFVVTIAFVAPVLRLLTWAIDEQRSPRGTPMVDELRRVPRQQPGARAHHDGGVRGGRRPDHQRPTVRQPAIDRLGQPPQRRRVRGARTGRGDGRRGGARRPRRPARADRARPAGRGRHRIVPRPRLRLRDPLPGAGDRRRPRPGSGRFPTR